MTKAGQSSPSPLAGISQSEGAALETWNRLNKMKWTKENNESGKKEKWKMKDGKKHRVRRITRKHTVGNNIVNAISQ